MTPKGHLFRTTSGSSTRTMSPTMMFLLSLLQHCLQFRFWRCYLRHLLQNCSVWYCTFLHLFRRYMSCGTNLPAGCSGALGFIVRTWSGVKGSRLVGSLIVWTDRGQLLTIAIASKTEYKVMSHPTTPILLIVLIEHSQTPPTWLDEGAFMTKWQSWFAK